MPKKECPSIQHILICGVMAIMLVFIGCQPVPKVKTPVMTDPRGAVFLETFEGPRFRATHPQTLSPDVIEDFFGRIFIRQERDFPASWLSTQPQTVRAFTDEEIAFLQPSVIQAFDMATPEEYVSFLVKHVEEGTAFQTSGSMYFTDTAWVVAFDRYRMPVNPGSTLSHPPQSFTRPPLWTLQFSPSDIVRPDQSFPHGFSENRPPSALSVDLDGLAHARVNVSVEEAVSDAGDKHSNQLEETQRAVRQLQEEMRQLRERFSQEPLP